MPTPDGHTLCCADYRNNGLNFLDPFAEAITLKLGSRRAIPGGPVILVRDREIISIKYLLAITLAATAGQALAATTSILITPRLSPLDPLATPACTGADFGNADRLCTFSGENIGYDFGSTAQLGVRHSVADSIFHGIVFQPGFNFDSYLPVSLENSPYSTEGVMSFTPLAGFETRLIGFDARGVNASFAPLIFKLFDAASQQIWSATVPGGLLTSSFTPFAVNSGWTSQSLRFTYGTTNTNPIGVSNFALEVRPIDMAPGVPEPASWAMMLLGFGLVGSAVRQRAALSRTIAD